MRFEFCLPDRIIFGSGSLGQVGTEAKRLGAQRALIATSPGMRERNAFCQAIESLRQQGITSVIFSDIEPEPPLQNAEDCAALARDSGCDLVLGLGGGSVMDVAKKAAADLGVPRMMVPSTAGSGSEVTHESVLRVDGRKRAFVDASLTPDVAIVDPDVSSTMPPRLTVLSAADALAHGIECYESRNANPLVQALALRACDLIGGNLSAALDNVPEARANLALGSLMAGMAFGNSGTALGHAMSYALSNRGVAHGQAVATILPYVLRFNGSAASFAGTLRRIASLTDPAWDPHWDIAQMTAEVMADTRHLANNPRTVTSRDVRTMFERMAADFAARPQQ